MDHIGGADTSVSDEVAASFDSQHAARAVEPNQQRVAMSPITLRILLALFGVVVLLLVVIFPAFLMRGIKMRAENGLRNSETLLEETRRERQRDIERAEQGLEMQRRGLELAERSMKAQEDVIALLRELVAKQRSGDREGSS